MNRLIELLDSVTWCLFLILVATVSFIQSNYGSSEWYFISFAVFTLCSIALLRMTQAQVKSYNLKGVWHARAFLIIYSLILLYLLFQIYVPYESSLYLQLFKQENILTPDWFAPAQVLSVTPELTYDLFWVELTMLAGVFLSIALLSSRRRLKQFLILILIVGSVHASVGIIAKYGSIILVEAPQIDGHFSAARAWFINRNHFAAFICLTLVSALSYQFRWIIAHQNGNFLNLFIAQLLGPRVIVPVAILLSFVALSLSQSRAGFFAILIAFSGVLFCSARHSKMFGKTRGLLFSLLAIAMVTVYYSGADLLIRLQMQESILGERLPQWLLTWNLIQQEWLFGYGGNSYATVFQSVRGDTPLRELIYNQAHNDYLHIFLEQGLIGLVLWLGLISMVFKQAWSGYCKTPSSLVAGVLLAAMVVITAALLQSMVGFNLQIINIRFYFFVIIALVFAAPTIRHKPIKKSA